MTNCVDVNEPEVGWTVRDVVETRLSAGITVADSPLITEAIEYARKLYEPYLFNHAMRSWLFASGRAQ